LAVAGVGIAILSYVHVRRVLRQRWAKQQLELWSKDGPYQEPVVEIEVPISQDEPDTDAVEVPVGLLFECDRLIAAMQQLLQVKDCTALIETLAAIWAKEEKAALAGEGENLLPLLQAPWLDLAALAQLTYWYDRRGKTQALAKAKEAASRMRIPDAMYGRWTRKLGREQVIYGTIALRTNARGHLGEKVFRRPAGIDVTRLNTLHRAAALCRHEPLLNLVEATRKQLEPKNVPYIPWEEVRKHTGHDDLWLLIDGKVYDCTQFLDIHPGGGQLIVDAAGQDATSAFELYHGEGLRYSLRLLNQFFIGFCTGFEEAEPCSPEAKPTPEFLTLIRSVTEALHTFDELHATGEAQGLVR